MHNIIKKFKHRKKEATSFHSSFKTGGFFEFFFEPTTQEEFVELISSLREKKINFSLIGQGTNILVADGLIKGVFITTKKIEKKLSIKRLSQDEYIMEASLSVNTKSLCKKALNMNLRGMNFALGIPGTIGGATFMNAGGIAGSVKDSISSAKLFMPTGKIENLKKDELKFSYRKLNIPAIVLETSFLLTKANKRELFEEARNLQITRKEKQDFSYPSCGSVFKNPDKDIFQAAGRLIEEVGLKGFVYGGAMVSKKHGNFILNFNKAKAKDILYIIDKIKDEVYKKFNIVLEEEVRIIRNVY